MSAHDPARGQSERELFSEALTKPTPAERAVFLEAACGKDKALRRRVEQLLSHHFAMDRFMSAPVADLPDVVGAAEASEAAGVDVERFKLLEKIGEGGMGVVYLAEQRQPVVRKVALKIIKLGMDSNAVVARFEAERQALALMDHPNIARVLDGGATKTGRPYFVMDLVQGPPITQFCGQNGLSIEQRTELFIPVCQAIQHAHQKGIIHRDIKPSNVLVAMQDGAPVPKVIDFGVAKALNQKLTDKTLVTNFATAMGTPAYMSPEQAEMTGLDIDTRSDIYSLGVLFYELLTGATPFAEERLRGVPFAEAQRIILEEEPERPSTRWKKVIATGATSSPGTAGLHNPQAGIDPDLDWIVMKCLEKDRNRRYETANGLAADLRRYLNSETVLARAPSRAYQLGKFLRRHRTASLAVAAVVFAVLLGAVISAWTMIRERAARQRAELRLRAAVGFVNDISDEVVPQFEWIAGGSKAQAALAQTGLKFARELRSTSVDDPRLTLGLANILVRLSRSQSGYGNNTSGDPESALKRAQEAIELLNDLDPRFEPHDRLWLLGEAHHRTATALEHLDRPEEALVIRMKHVAPLKKELIERFPSSAAKHRPDLLLNQILQAADLTQSARAREAIDQYLMPLLESEWARSISTNSTPDDIRTLVTVHGNLGFAYQSLGDWSFASQHFDALVRLDEILVAGEPDKPLYVHYLATHRAFRALAKAHLGMVAEGLAELKASRELLESALLIDASSYRLQSLVCLARLCQASALAVSSGATNSTLEARRDRLASAKTHLSQAEAMMRAMSPPPRTREFPMHGEWAPVQCGIGGNRRKRPPNGLRSTWPAPHRSIRCWLFTRASGSRN